MSEKVKRIKAEFGCVILKPYPEEGTWYSSCPFCGKQVRLRLSFDAVACEFQIEILHEEES